MKDSQASPKWFTPITSNLKLVLLLSIVLISSVYTFAQPTVHDPSTMIKNTDGRYWIFCTGNGVTAMSSTDSTWYDWKYETSIFPNAYPSWLDTYVIDFGGHFWAPDVIYMNGYYYLYYSASSWGSTSSAIGVARTTQLDKPWTDLGKVIASSGSPADRNAIDPAVFKDNDGRVWMSYGSFFGGLGVVEIDTVTGKTIGNVTGIAGGGHQDIEAPYITRNGDYYYLFANRGACCNGLESTYNIHVARSTSVTGPYTGWRSFLSHEDRFHGPGHVGVGEGLFTYHFYDTQSNGTARLSISTISYEDGWPVPGTPQSWNPNSSDITDGTYRIIAEHSGMAIEVKNDSPTEGANVQQGALADENGQYWGLTDVGDNWYKITAAANPELGFDVFNISSDNGANIVLWSYWGGDGQQWKFKEVGSEVYQIISRHSNKCLQVKDAAITDEANIYQMTCDETNESQLFTLHLPVFQTGIDDYSLNTNFTIYPNPAKEFISIQLPNDLTETVSIRIYDQLGRQMLSYTSIKNLKNAINIQQLPAGKYIAKITSGNQHITRSFIKL